MAAQTLAKKTCTFASRTICDAQDAISNAHDGLLALEAVETILHTNTRQDLHLVQSTHLACLLGILREHIGAHMREAEQLTRQQCRGAQHDLS